MTRRRGLQTWGTEAPQLAGPLFSGTPKALLGTRLVAPEVEGGACALLGGQETPSARRRSPPPPLLIQGPTDAPAPTSGPQPTNRSCGQEGRSLSPRASPSGRPVGTGRGVVSSWGRGRAGGPEAPSLGPQPRGVPRLQRRCPSGAGGEAASGGRATGRSRGPRPGPRGAGQARVPTPGRARGGPKGGPGFSGGDRPSSSFALRLLQGGSDRAFSPVPSPGGRFLPLSPTALSQERWGRGSPLEPRLPLSPPHWLALHPLLSLHLPHVPPASGSSGLWACLDLVSLTPA